eukprot:30135-Pelagococcus_subviridis.AAC.5
MDITSGAYACGVASPAADIELRMLSVDLTPLKLASDLASFIAFMPVSPSLLPGSFFPPSLSFFPSPPNDPLNPESADASIAIIFSLAAAFFASLSTSLVGFPRPPSLSSPEPCALPLPDAQSIDALLDMDATAPAAAGCRASNPDAALGANGGSAADPPRCCDVVADWYDAPGPARPTRSTLPPPLPPPLPLIIAIGRGPAPSTDAPSAARAAAASAAAASASAAARAPPPTAAACARTAAAAARSSTRAGRRETPATTAASTRAAESAAGTRPASAASVPPVPRAAPAPAPPPAAATPAGARRRR